MVNRDSERIPLSVSEREKQINKRYDYYGASGVIDKVEGYLFDTPLLLIGEDGANLLTRNTPIAFIAQSGKYWVNNHAHVLDCPYFPTLKYVESFINAISLAPYVTGTAQPKMNQEKMNSILIPLPPLAEQQRICEQIERLMPKASLYAKVQKQLTEFELAFPVTLKKSILQSAVEGKLVPQEPNDESASVLVERIAEERKALIKAGKLKRDKHESVIFRGSDRLTYETRDGETVCIEDELPFKIPKSWAWVRLGSVATIIRGSGIKRDEIVPVGVPCIRYGELYTTYQTRIDAVISHTTESVASRAKSIKHGDVILTLTGENKEDIGMAAAYLGKDDAVVGGDVAVLKDHHCDPLWLSYFLAAPFAVGQKAGMSNGDIIVHLSVQSVASIMVPLPPLAEQKRIVAQIEKMLKVSAALTT